jgi:hypothetical protein
MYVTPAKAGVQNLLERLDSGLAVIPDPDPGRNDGKENFSTFYKSISVFLFKNYFMGMLRIHKMSRLKAL